MSDFEVTGELTAYFDVGIEPVELVVSSNTGKTEELKLADGQILYIKPGKDKIVVFDWRDCSYHLKDCGCDLCQR